MYFSGSNSPGALSFLSCDHRPFQSAQLAMSPREQELVTGQQPFAPQQQLAAKDPVSAASVCYKS